MSSTVLSNELAALAEDAGDAWRSSRAAAKESAERALAAGYILIAARNRCAYGEWGVFLRRAGLAERQAQRLMQLARSFVNPDTVSALGGIKATLAALGKFRLPGPGQMVLIDNLADPRSFGFVWPSAEHDGGFNLVGSSEKRGAGVRFMTVPVPALLVFTMIWDMVPPSDEAPVFLIAPADDDLPRFLAELLAGESEPLHGEPIAAEGV